MLYYNIIYNIDMCVYIYIYIYVYVKVSFAALHAFVRVVHWQLEELVWFQNGSNTRVLKLSFLFS